MGTERIGRKELRGVAVCLYVGTNKSLRVRLANIDRINVNSWSPCGHSNARLQPLRRNGVLGPGLISWQLPVMAKALKTQSLLKKQIRAG